MGKFMPPTDGGVIWPGDLLAFSTREVGGDVKIVDRNGNPTTILTKDNAQWSAADALEARL